MTDLQYMAAHWPVRLVRQAGFLAHLGRLKLSPLLRQTLPRLAQAIRL